MEKILKKSLAVFVATALCLTAFIGCLTTSAAEGDPTGTLKIAAVTAEAGAETVKVPITLATKDPNGIAGAIFDLTFDNGLTFAGIDTTDVFNVSIEYATTDGEGKVANVVRGDTTSSLRFLVVGQSKEEDIKTFNTLTFDVIFTGLVAGTYAVTVPSVSACNAGTADMNGVYADDEDYVYFTDGITPGSVTVPAPVPEHVHAWGNWVSLGETQHKGTCTATGCTDPVATTTEDHTWDAGVITQDPTCKSEGVKTFTCSKCGAKKTEAVSTIGHTAKADPDVAATCTADGSTGGIHCSFCDTVITPATVVPALGHTWSDWSVTTPATVEAEGVETRTCSVCNETETRPIEKLTPVLTTSLKERNSSTKYVIYVKFNYSFTGTQKTQGALIYRAANYTDGMTIDPATADIIAPLTSVNNYLNVGGFTLSSITEKFVFVPYVTDQNDKYYFGTAEKVSYVDCLLDKLASGTDAVKAKANGILDIYYQTFGTVAYEGQVAGSYPDFSTASTYAVNTPYSIDNVGEFVSTPVIQGNLKSVLYLQCDYSDYSGSTPSEYGILVYRQNSYTDGMIVSVDNADIRATLSKPSSYLNIKGFTFEKTNERFVFVPYVKDAEGQYHYGSRMHISYADHLVSKMNAATEGNASSITTAKIAKAYLDLYNSLYDTSLYSAN